MPYDSVGNFSLPPGSIVATGQKVLPSQHNPPLQDIATNGLSNVMTRDGRGPMTASLPMGGNKITGMADGTAATDAATVGQAAYAIGDFKSSARVLDDKWLRRDGALYNSADYPDLAAVLPALPDGVSWSNTNVITSGLARGLITTPSGFMMLRDDGTNTQVFTTDGTAATWSQVATIPNFRATDVALGGGVYVAVDGFGKTSSSNDGINWSSPTAAISGAGAGLTGVAYGAGLFIAVGSRVPSSAQQAVIVSSDDGSTWTERRLESSAIAFYMGVRFINGTFVAVGTSGAICTSLNGTTWTARTSGVSSFLYDAAWDGANYTVVGGSGVIIQSANLASWSARTSGTSQDLYAIARSSAGYLALGFLGTARISTNGTTWTASAMGTSSSFYRAIVDPNNAARYLAGGSALFVGIRTLPTQFRTPSDDPTYGWIKAKA